VIDTNGVVRHIFNSQFNATKHVEEAISVLKSIREKSETPGPDGSTSA
jgi:thioredoxin-dependent peroxiredoxin